MLRAVLFDLDDTLIPETRAWQEALLATTGPVEARLGLPAGALGETVQAIASARFLGPGPGLDAATRIGVSWEECLWGKFGPASALQLPGLGTLASVLRRTAWADALVACGQRPELHAVELEARFGVERRKRLRPYPDAAATIAALRERNLLLGCVTNGASEVQREKLRETGVEPWFDVTLVSGEEGVGKPDPQLLSLACDRLGVSPGEAIYVGNSPGRDVACATAAGLGSVLVDRGVVTSDGREPPPTAPPDRIVYEVSGILGFVDGWRAGRAFRVLDAGGAALAVDEPTAEDGAFFARVGPERDPLRPALRGATRAAAVQAGLRALRARAPGPSFRHERGEPVDWDALLR